ncbi:MAG: membrane protein insertase YidC [Gammaproteobacteria bacterium]
MDYKRIFAYVILFFSAFLLWNAWQAEHAPKTENTQASTTQQSLPTSTASAAETTTPGTNVSSVPQIIPQGKRITIKTDVLTVAIDTKGGDLVQSKLHDYPETIKTPDAPYTLLDNKTDDTYLAQSGVVAQGQQPQPLVFSAPQAEYQLKDSQDQLNVVLTAKTADGLLVTKTYTFYRGEYKVDLSMAMKNETSNTWVGQYYLQLVRSNTPPKSENFVHYAFFGAAVSSPEKHYQKLKFKNLAETPLNQTISDGWLAMIQHYFVSAWVPPTQESFRYYSLTNNNLYTLGSLSPVFSIQPNQIVNKTGTLYSGPAIATNLDAVAPNLKLTIDYGWFWFISVILFWLMQHIYNIIGNWGWSIVLVTVLIKAVFYKLSAKSYRSMAEMKRLQPKIKMLQERFSDDKQKLSQATMELYRKEKVNPLGGCLPLLVQIPVFIGLYWVLAESVQLRQAPFILWIHDLSLKDPYYVLPVLMGLSMLIQQKISPPPPDPMQAKMMMLLPVVFTVFFLNFPAGLVLYWVVNNSLSILQQWLLMRKFAKETPAQQRKRKKKK